jgi:hypothetical protein
VQKACAFFKLCVCARVCVNIQSVKLEMFRELHIDFYINFPFFGLILTIIKISKQMVCLSI